MPFQRLFDSAGPIRGLPVLARYLLATAVVLAFCVLRSAVTPLMGGYPFLLFFPAIILISLLFDRGTGVYAVILSALLAAYLFMPPSGTLHLGEPTQLVPLVLYVAVGLFLAVVIEALRTTAERLQSAMTAAERAARLNSLLLDDINHRVKNHLQSVTALLRLSKRDLTEPAAQAVLETAAARIDILGDVYRRLHLGEHRAELSARDFLMSLVDDLRASVVGVRPVQIACRAEEARLSSTQAVALGLIANELIQNALKHAFPDGRDGTIEISFTWDGADADGRRLRLRVADDGVGRAHDAAEGGGSRLMRSLARQLGGALHVQPGAGTCAEVAFPERETADVRPQQPNAPRL